MRSQLKNIIFAAAVFGLCLEMFPAGNILDGAKVQCAVSQDGRQGEWQTELELNQVGTYKVSIRAVFNVEDPGDIAFLKLDKPKAVGNWSLNGRTFEWLLKDVRYSSVTGIPGSFLVKGENVLEASDDVRITSHRDKVYSQTVRCSEISLVPQSGRDFSLAIGPVLGNAGKDFFTVKCIGSMPAKITLSVDGRKMTSENGFYHEFNVEGLKPSTEYEFLLSSQVEGTAAETVCGSYKVRTLPDSGKLFFISVGDAQLNPKVWGEISEIARKESPMFHLRTGDLVQNGRDFNMWVDEFWKPAVSLSSTVPAFCVFGNHEENSSLFLKMFSTPGNRKTWYQEIGPVLLVGADIYDLEGRTFPEYLAYIEGILSKSKAKFIFLLNHSPAWSSANHGGNEQSREIFKLLEKYNGTAMLSGHEHCYERTEPGKGTSIIVSGGAGAPLYAQKNIEKNPFSKVFFQEYNYLTFTVEGDTCTMKAIALGDKETFGKQPPREIDSVTWQAREMDMR